MTQVYTGLNNPTRMVRQGAPARVFFVNGFDQGPNQGRVQVFDPAAALANPPNNPGTLVTVQGFVPTSPFDIIGDGANIFVSYGVGVFGAGRIDRLSGINTATGAVAAITNLTANANPVPNNPLFLLFVPAAQSADGGPLGDLYWTEYQAAPNGRIRRIDLDAGPPFVVQDIMTGLNFPADLATDGAARLFVADSAGGINGQILRLPTLPNGPLPIGTTNPQVTVIGVQAGEPAITRPFELQRDVAGGIVAGTGMSVPQTAVVGAPAALGQGIGTLRYIPLASATSRLIQAGRTNVAGVAVVGPDAGSATPTHVVTTFVESIALTGTSNLIEFDSATNPIVVRTNRTGANALQIGLNDPFHTLPSALPAVCPVLVIENFASGQANGVIWDER